MNLRLIGKFSVLALLLLAQAARAEINAIRLSGQAQPYCWDLAEIVKAVTEGKTSGREKALALHAFGMAHQIHFIGPYEGGLEVDDPLKLIAVYGYDLCGNNSSTMCALYNLAGLKARRRGLTGHVVRRSGSRTAGTISIPTCSAMSICRMIRLSPRWMSWWPGRSYSSGPGENPSRIFPGIRRK